MAIGPESAKIKLAGLFCNKHARSNYRFIVQALGTILEIEPPNYVELLVGSLQGQEPYRVG